MSRYIAFGILRRDFQVLATGEDRDEVASIAETSVRRGLVDEAFVVQSDLSFVQGIVEPLPADAPLPAVAPAPLNLNHHPQGLSADQVLGGQFMKDVNEPRSGATESQDVSGRTEVVDKEAVPIDSSDRPKADPTSTAAVQ